MSSVSRCSGALLTVVLSSVVVACGGTSATDLFAPSTGTGQCRASPCASYDAAPPQGSVAAATSTGAGGGSSTGAGGGEVAGGSSGASSVTSGMGGASTTGTTTGAVGTTGAGGATGSTGGAGPDHEDGGTGVGGSGGAAGSVGDGGAAGAPPIEADASSDGTLNPHPIDSGPPDQRADAVAGRDACVPSGVERCDGIDNNCNDQVDERACPDGCTGVAFRGVGHMICYSQAQDRSWSSAEMVCVSRGMQLARIDNADHDEWIRKVATGVNIAGHVWIGASDLEREGAWQWNDGTAFWMGGVTGRPVENRFSHWAAEQPNDNGSEDCAAVYMPLDAWNDVDCDGRHSFLCQDVGPTR